MNEALHPLSLGEILDLTAQLYRSRFLVYFGIAVIPAGVVLVFAAGAFVFFAWAGSDVSNRISSPLGSVLVWLFLSVVVLLALPACLGSTALGWAAMNHAAARAFLGEPISIRQSYAGVWKRGWHYVWLLLLLGFFVAVAPMGVALTALPATVALQALARRAGMGAAATLLGVGIVLVMIALAAYALWMLLRLSLAFPASVIERISAWSALKRSSALSQGTRGRLSLLYLLGVALGQLLVLGFSLPLGVLMSLVPGAGNPRQAQMMGTILVFVFYGLWFVVQALTKPVYGIALTLFYFDQRIRKEGFDIEWMMHQAGLTAPPSLQPAISPAAAVEASLPGEQQA